VTPLRFSSKCGCYRIKDKTAEFVILILSTVIGIVIWGHASNAMTLYDSFGDVAFCLFLWLIAGTTLPLYFFGKGVPQEARELTLLFAVILLVPLLILGFTRSLHHHKFNLLKTAFVFPVKIFVAPSKIVDLFQQLFLMGEDHPMQQKMGEAELEKHLRSTWKKTHIFVEDPFIEIHKSFWWISKDDVPELVKKLDEEQL